MPEPGDDQSEYRVRPGSPAVPWARASNRQGVGRQSSCERPDGESAEWVAARTPADNCLLGQHGHTLTRRACPPARSRNRRGPDELRTGQRRNSRLDSANPGRLPILAADRPGTRYLTSATTTGAARGGGLDGVRGVGPRRPCQTLAAGGGTGRAGGGPGGGGRGGGRRKGPPCGVWV